MGLSVMIITLLLLLTIHICIIILGIAGQENFSNTEGGALRFPEQLAGRRDSVSSLDSTMSSSLTASQTDLPEQYEVIKQQKDIIEHGIELWGPFHSFVVWMNTLKVTLW